ALLRVRGGATGILGTIQYVVGDEIRPAGQTTPEALEIEAMLAAMRARGVRGVAMEVSSHALALSRVDALAFDVGVFTNLTQDHLDFHGTLDEYGRAKRRLFELLAASPKPRRTAVVNGDDPAGARMVAGLGLDTLTYGLGAGIGVRATEWTSTLDGVRLAVDTPAGRLGVVFGCGGDRDRTKRPIMGEIAARLADRAWITSDNPRSEDPDAIIAEIAAGVARVWRERDRYARLADRHAAIGSALAWARPGDTLVIAGKGHETYQIVGTDVLPFDDREVARRLLSE